METISEDLYLAAPAETRIGRKQTSYWEHTFEFAGLTDNEVANDNKSFDVDTFIVSVFILCSYFLDIRPST